MKRTHLYVTVLALGTMAMSFTTIAEAEFPQIPTGTGSRAIPAVACGPHASGEFQGEQCFNGNGYSRDGHWDHHDADGGEMAGQSQGVYSAGGAYAAQKNGHVASSVFQGQVDSNYSANGTASVFTEHREGRFLLDGGGVLSGHSILNTNRSGSTVQMDTQKNGQLNSREYDHVQYDLNESSTGTAVTRTEHYEGRIRLDDGGVLNGHVVVRTNESGGLVQMDVQKNGQVVSSTFHGQMHMNSTSDGVNFDMVTHYQGEWPIGNGDFLDGTLIIRQSGATVTIQDDRVTR